LRGLASFSSSWGSGRAGCRPRWREPGAISLDQAQGISWSGDSWGLAALAAGLIGGAMPLLARKTARPSAAPGVA
jgi:hypothetical protein